MINIIEGTDNDSAVEDYLKEENRNRNRFSFKPIVLGASLILCGSPKLKAVNHLPSIKSNFDFSKTERIKKYSDELDDYVQELNASFGEKITKDELINEILSFKALESNWDGYGAVPLEIKSATNAILVLSRMRKDDLSKVGEIYPNPHGTLTIEFENDTHEKLHLEIGNKSFGYFIELNGMDVRFFDDLNFTEDNIKDLLSNIKSL